MEHKHYNLMGKGELNYFLVKREELENGNFREVSINGWTFFYQGTPLPETLPNYPEGLPEIKVFEAYRLIGNSPEGIIAQRVKNKEMKGCLVNIVRNEITDALIALETSEEPSRTHMRIMRERYGSDLDSDGLDLIGFPDE